MSGIQHTVVLDRWEGNLAVLLADKEKETVRFHLPRALLPEGCREGDHLTLTLAVDTETTAAAKAEVAEQMAALKPKRGDFEV